MENAIALEEHEIPHIAGLEKCDDVALVVGYYADGSPALRLYGDGEPWCTVTVWVALPAGQHLAGRCVLIKDWGENAGLLEEIILRGWGTLSGRHVPTGAATAYEFELNNKIWRTIMGATTPEEK